MWCHIFNDERNCGSAAMLHSTMWNTIRDRENPIRMFLAIYVGDIAYE
jgi:hypothetical protein